MTNNSQNSPTPNRGNSQLNFPSEIHFIYPWRSYQKRVLDQLDQLLEDGHLHVIAPPGSGKTILGLEVTLRINKPTLIFAPTIAIRNQWIERFCELFLQSNKIPDWISKDIKKPKFLTVSTYQGLHAACTGVDVMEEDIEEEGTGFLEEKKGNTRTTKEKTEEIIARLREQNIGTIVLDEAHHLKNAWWQSLMKIKGELKPTIVGLTATPPYDVSYPEWQRYLELNGPIDAEISVPELVVEENLCPHQDFVIFSEPTSLERKKIHDFRVVMEDLFYEFKEDTFLTEAIEKHPVFVHPEECLDWIYVNLEYYSAILIYLNAAGKEISKKHLEVVGDKKLHIPNLNYEWLEILLSFYLFKDADFFGEKTEHQERLIKKLKRSGALEKRTINFRHNRKIDTSISSSIGKLQSIKEIVAFEKAQLKEDLRMVILTDYIRKEYLVEQEENTLELNKIGVLPIFEQLRRSQGQNIKMGVLSGSIVIVPLAAFDLFQEIATQYKVDKLSTRPLPFDPNYLIINATSQIKHDLVSIVTQLFQKGKIEVLVGTKSLLGEGWDAPAINSLILASFVGSYVLSNQMRGRAIRTDSTNKNKTGNIWHLVCVDTTSPDGGIDFDLLKRRFHTFVGVSFKENLSIENGFMRLNLPEKIETEQEVKEVNAIMFEKAKEREKLKEKWQETLKRGTILIEEIKVPFPKNKNYKETIALYYNRTIKYLFAMLVSGLASFFFEVLEATNEVSRNLETKEDLLLWFSIIVIIALLLFGGLAFNAFRMYIKYRDIAKDAHQISEALLRTLIQIGVIQTSFSQLEIFSLVDKQGTIYCHLEGGTTYEKSIFIKSLTEIINPVGNPRYLIIRKSRFLKIFSQKDYHAVPEIVGKKKEFASFFAQQWKEFVGASELVFTRTIEGRKLVLKSRIHSLASEFEPKMDRINRWR